jgi:hypothetical protein
MSQLKPVLERKQAQVKQLEMEYQSADDKLKKLQYVLPLVELTKDFWSSFRGATVSSNGTAKGDGLVELPSNEGINKGLKEMVDILVEGFSIDSKNRVTVQLCIPILEGIETDALSCRQLVNTASP